jgi:hypothetical protein
MIENLSSTADVVAIRCQGKLGREEMDLLINRLATALRQNERTNVYAEVIHFGGFEVGELPHYLKSALPFFRNLERFGRVAVVSDSAWLRAATRLESALLPHVSYETFTLDESDKALAWVEGRSSLPHGPTLKIIEVDRPEVIGFELDGKLTMLEVQAITRYMEQKLEGESALRVLGRVKRAGLADMHSFLDADFIAMKRHAFDRIERYAIVGGPAWLAAWVRLLDTLVKTEIRHFDMDDEASAWQWLEAKPREERPLLPG